MKFSLLALVAVLSVASVAGLAVIPPSGCPQYNLDDISLPSLAAFLPNLLHYNKASVMSGSPIGPYFGIDESAGCIWRPNGAFSCALRVYLDSGLTTQIGTASMTSSNLIWNNDAFNTSGGYVNFTSSLSLLASQLPNPGNPSAPENRNFQSQSRLIYFQPKIVYPDAPATPIANRVANIGGQLYLTLWGSDGYLPASDSFDPATRGTGMDFMAHLVCPGGEPPVIPGCPCDNPAYVFSVPRSSIVPGVEIVRRSEGTCIELNFA